MLQLKYNEPCEAYFKQQCLLTVPCIYILQCGLFVKKFPHYFTLNSDVHHHNTRQSKNIHVMTKNLHINDYNPVNACTTIYNALPASLKSIDSVIKFKKEVTNYLIEKCFYSVTHNAYNRNNNKKVFME